MGIVNTDLGPSGCTCCYIRINTWKDGLWTQRKVSSDHDEDSPHHTHRKLSGQVAEGGERQAVCLHLFQTGSIVFDDFVDKLEQRRGDRS